jgi:DNA-binding LytR/AlgR family response regulator
MKIAIVDDDPASQKELAHFLESSSIEPAIAAVSFPSAGALMASSLVSFDAFFLDIYLGNEDGIALAENLRKELPHPLIIFVTSSKERAVEAFSLDAIHYLVKPLSQEKVDEAMNRLQRELEKSGKKIIFESKQGLLSVQLNELIYIESFGNDKFFKLVNRSFSLRRSTSEVLALLANDPRFYVLSRSYIINLEYVKGMKGDDLELSNGERLPIPHQRKKEVTETFFAYLHS